MVKMLHGEKAVTLMEVLVVLIIIGIIAATAYPGFEKSRNQVLGKEAVANLRLIAAAEKIYRMEHDSQLYRECVNTGDCNTELRLDLNNRNWNYRVDTPNPAVSATIIATRVGDPGCTYTLTSLDFDGAPLKGTCPAGME